jgi:hypothetical protein
MYNIFLTIPVTEIVLEIILVLPQVIAVMEVV